MLARTTPAVSFTLNWRWDCDMVGLFMVCEKASLPDAVGLRSLKSRTIIALNLRAGVYSSNTLSLIFSLPIHLLLSKCEIRTCCVTLAYFSGTFRFKMHCIIFGRLTIIFALPILWHCASRKWFPTRSTSRPEETTVYICVYVYKHIIQTPDIMFDIVFTRGCRTL